MKPEVLLLWSPHPTTCSYSEADKSSSRSRILFYIDINIILSSIIGFSKQFLSLRFPHHNPAYIFLQSVSPLCPIHPTIDLFNRLTFGETCKSLSFSFAMFSSLLWLLHTLVQVLISTLLRNTVSPCSSLNMGDQILMFCWPCISI